MYREPDPEAAPLLIVAFNDQVMALDRVTGALRWYSKLRSAGSSVELAIHAGRVYAICGNGMLHVLTYEDGAEVTRRKLSGRYVGRATLVVDADHLFIASGGEVCCIDRDGKDVWFNGLEGKGVGLVSIGFPGNLRQSR